MEFPLLKCNNLVRTDSSVWTVEPKGSFDYSDGETAEEYLNDVIMNAQDLTSQSVELDEKIIDWPSEYHLSSKRANLLRGLKLDGIKNVLELGSGCGAITRYIGEMNIYIDAVEGSPRRAEISRLRCRNLENVNIINANFNELIFPEAAYDAILLIGVVEYAKRYFPGAVDDKNAVTNLLSNARSALKKDGVLFIAIENRMGLKYWMGASEDHYGQPHVGLYGYPQDEGIRTYDKKKWGHILEMADMKYFRFLYPFPDYKMPKIILSDTYIKSDEYAHSALYRVSSRDYTKTWHANIDEFLLLESIHKSGYLEDFANSFFIVISDSEKRLNQVVPYDFVHFSDNIRKPVYRTLTVKPRNKDYIIKKRVVSAKEDRNAGLIRHKLSKDIYIKGPLLSSLWIHSLFKSIFNFEKLVKEYYAFINDYFSNHEETSGAYDLMPSNIIVDATGSYKVIDSEWSINAKIIPEYVLFRGLMWFFNYNGMLINRIYDENEFSTVKECIEYGFNLCSLELKQELAKFIELEDRVQREICFQGGQGCVESMLMGPLHYGKWIFQTNAFLSQLYWAGDNQEFSGKRSMTVSGFFERERQVLIFRLPYSIVSFRYLRLDPADCQGFFQLFKVSLKRIDLKGTKEELLWQLQGAQDIARYSQMEGVHFCKARATLGEVFLSTSDDPQLVFEFQGTIKGDSKKGFLQFEVEMDWPKSDGYMIAEEALKKEIAICAQQLEAERLFSKNLMNSRSWKLMAPFRLISKYTRELLE